MDIISAHREGLTEKLDLECVDLAGRPRDFGQRAIVLHHLYDHSLRGHAWALLEAIDQMATDRALQALARRASPWWRGAAGHVAAANALSRLQAALGEEGARRTAAAYRAYRMAGTPALEAMLPDHMSADHANQLLQLHARRREGRKSEVTASDTLAMAVEADVGLDPFGHVATAWAAIDRTFLKRGARRELKRLSLDQLLARHSRRGWARPERALRDDPYLPAAFRANPAQHFYALQHGLAERRRKDWVEGLGESEALAA